MWPQPPFQAFVLVQLFFKVVFPTFKQNLSRCWQVPLASLLVVPSHRALCVHSTSKLFPSPCRTIHLLSHRCSWTPSPPTTSWTTIVDSEVKIMLWMSTCLFHCKPISVTHMILFTECCQEYTFEERLIDFKKVKLSGSKWILIRRSALSQPDS